MVKVTFIKQNEVSDDKFKFAVIAAKYSGKWILCRHKERTTWEIPGGHREAGETPLQAAKRELFESTAYIYRIIGVDKFIGYVGYIYPNGIVVFEKLFEFACFPAIITSDIAFLFS